MSVTPSKTTWTLQSHLPMSYIQLALSCAALIANIVGICSIALRKKKSNQNIILSSLSISEIFQVVFRISNTSEVFHGQFGSSWTTLVHRYALWSSSHQILFTMYVLSIDRLLCASNPLTYKIQVTRKRMILLIFVTAMLSMLFGILRTHFPRGFNVVWLLAGTLYVVLTIITYAVVIMKIRRSRQHLHQHTELKLGLKKDFLMPSVIIFTFICFYGVPALVVSCNKSKSLVGYLEIVQLCGFFLDPVTYILLVKHYRLELVKRLSRWKISRISNSGDTVVTNI